MTTSPEALLQVEKLVKYFPSSDNSSFFRRRTNVVHAVDGISFSLSLVRLISKERDVGTGITAGSGREPLRLMAVRGLSGGRDTSSILPRLEGGVIRPGDTKDGVFPESLAQGGADEREHQKDGD